LRLLLFVLSALLLSSCSDDAEPSLVVDLRTDWMAGTEVVRVRSQLTRGSFATPPSTEREILEDVAPGTDLMTGHRIASFEALEPGTWTLRVALLDAAGATLGTRTAEVELERPLGLLITITRDCASVTCPGDGDGDPTETECLARTCISPRCHSGNPAGCPDLETCTTADTCAVPDCATAACLDGLCLATPDDAVCATDELCDVSLGCVRESCIDGGSMNDLCDGTDDDCDGMVDEGHDTDGDGFTHCGSGMPALADCDDTLDTVYPDAPELCDEVDNDCDGDLDELICRCLERPITAGGRMYWSCNNNVNRNAADEGCESLGHVWKIDDLAENDAVHAQLPFPAIALYWIGLRRDDEGTFRWPDGSEPSYENWAPGHPGAEECVLIDIVGTAPPQWKTSRCDVNIPYVCEAP